MPISDFRFPKQRRLGGRLEFRAVFDAKVKESRGPITVYSKPNGLEFGRFGISISRTVGIAVKRNRIKRLLREAFRTLTPEVPKGFDWVVVVRPHETMTLARYQEVLISMMGKLSKRRGIVS